MIVVGSAVSIMKIHCIGCLGGVSVNTGDSFYIAAVEFGLRKKIV